MKKLLLLLTVLPLMWVFSQNNLPNAGPASKEAAKKIGEYRIVEDASAAGLAKRVNQAMGTGWEPAGGVCSYPGSGVFAQAMIKREGDGA